MTRARMEAGTAETPLGGSVRSTTAVPKAAPEPCHLPRYEAGCRMPSSHSITMSDQTLRTRAEEANHKFIEALNLYFRRGGRA